MEMRSAVVLLRQMGMEAVCAFFRTLCFSRERSIFFLQDRLLDRSEMKR